MNEKLEKLNQKIEKTETRVQPVCRRHKIPVPGRV